MIYKEIYCKEPCIQIYPTTRGWTVRAYQLKPKYKQKFWHIKEPNIADHKSTDIKKAVDEALDWFCYPG